MAVGALAFRLPRLDQRPMHTDEAVNTVKAGILLETGRYTYDPNEYHGPTPYYFALPFIWLRGAKTLAETTETMFRIVPVLFGVGLVLLLLGMSDGLGRPAAMCAAVLTAVSPAMVFYSRYYIQEMLLVFFTFAAIVCGWRYTRSPKLRWALLGGVCLGLMHATKETCVLAFISAVGALGLTVFWARWREGESGILTRRLATRRSGRHLIAALVVGAVISTVIMSAFFTNPREPLDAILAYLNYFGRAAAATGPGVAAHHHHPWYYYLQTLLYAKYSPGPWWSEALIVVLSLGGVIVTLFRARARKETGTVLSERLREQDETAPVFFNRHLVRFLAFYTILMTVVYALIPYKTPWCMLGFLHGMILLAGVGAVAIVRALPNRPARVVACVLLAAGAVHLGVQAYRANFVFYADTRNPYVYGHSATDVVRLAERVEDLAALHPDGHGMLVKIMAPDSDYWPLPWYLRRFERVGYWTDVPDDPDAPVVITAVGLEEDLNQKLRDTYQQEYYGLRPEVLLTAYIRLDLWNEFIKSRS